MGFNQYQSQQKYQTMELPQLHAPSPNQQHSLVRLQNMPRTTRKEHRLKIDVSKTQYPLIKTIAQTQLGWKVWTREDSKEEIHLFWVDTYVHEDFLRKMKPYQRVNHILGSQNLGKKNQLSSNISRMRKLLPKQYSFYPNTFNFPAEIQEYQKFAKSNQDCYYIVKPCSDSQGRGIYLTKQPDTNSKDELVVQQYIHQPLLIQKNKFDLRLYVLLKSISPLKIYVYEEGLCRLATSEYEKPQSSNQKNTNMHLTNYAINKLSPNFIFNKSEYQDNVGHKRSLSSAYKSLQQMGYRIDVLKQEIDKIIVKTILAVQPLLLKKYKQVRDNREQNENICFQILGFDILVKQDGSPMLLEVNHSPSFCTQTPLDLLIKKCLILDTLNILNLNIEDKINYIKSRSQQDNISNNQTFRSCPRNIVIAAQPESTGGYRKIYPVDNPEHSQLSKLYQGIIKVGKAQRMPRMVVSKKFPDSLLNPKNPQQSQQLLDMQVKSEIDNIIFKSQNKKNNRTLSLYHVINTLKRTRLNQLKSVIQYEQICNPISFIPQPTKKLDLHRQKRSQQFNPEQSKQLVKKEEVTLYQRRHKKDREIEKKKYVQPLPIANVHIRLDQKYSHKLKQDRHANSQAHDTENPFKIHSFINTSYFAERKRSRQEGNRTASNAARESNSLQDKFGMTEKSNRFTSYSIQLKQKIERMQIARIRIQKHRKIDKTNFLILRSQFPEEQPLNTPFFGQAQ